ncbi:hypothetical protein [Shewanella sp. 6_MG-2023]|uniref:hypothetical protein n=1 Tax=Shewanella sp. 6_MG-2023 TaxID=3062660 RepID=UPI0026E355BC|nr:hypothetical protein [Shewanella sp. 6_MG-2023]MDO6617616.1 hypothetical protein [Shewanella sp. 6_MG-2023]
MEPEDFILAEPENFQGKYLSPTPELDLLFIKLFIRLVPVEESEKVFRKYLGYACNSDIPEVAIENVTALKAPKSVQLFMVSDIGSKVLAALKDKHKQDTLLYEYSLKCFGNISNTKMWLNYDL